MQLNVQITERLKEKLNALSKTSDKSYSTLVREWINKAHSKFTLENNNLKISRIDALELKMDLLREEMTEMKKNLN